mmetsp:Transcript_131737/g.256587  ORF Transcript_131737/g.256587 Transcript_131737/m.256587 type:complete len:171 (+) Transcript_131737:82-594(+)
MPGLSDTARRRKDAESMDGHFVCSLTGALLDPSFQQAMDTLCSEASPAPAASGSRSWSWDDQPEATPDEYMGQIQRAIERLEKDQPQAGMVGTDGPCSGPAWQSFVEELGLEEGADERRRQALASAPNVVAQLTAELQQAVDLQKEHQSRLGGTLPAELRHKDDVGCLNQ